LSLPESKGERLNRPTACRTNCTVSLHICGIPSTIIFEYGSARFFATVVQTTTSLVYSNYKNILGVSIGLRPAFGYNTRTQEPTNRPHDKHSNRQRFYPMTPIEQAIVEKLRENGPCCLDDVVTSLPNSSWGEIFLAVDRMSRNGRLSLLQIGYSTYQITLKTAA
jgi:hypothetical protein